jgi:hypothetical protein
MTVKCKKRTIESWCDAWIWILLETFRMCFLVEMIALAVLFFSPFFEFVFGRSQI